MEELRNGKIALNEINIREYIDRTARNVVQYLIGENLSVSVAESCTGGLIASAITSVSGASAVFECGIVSYSERIKEEIVGVPRETIESFGVVSAQTAIAMAEGVKKLSGSDLAIAVTGLAGPKSESDTLPVGTVYISTVYRGKAFAENLRLYELGGFGRNMNRLLSAAFALERALVALEGRGI